jgi:hypothetical protein
MIFGISIDGRVTGRDLRSRKKYPMVEAQYEQARVV